MEKRKLGNFQEMRCLKEKGIHSDALGSLERLIGGMLHLSGAMFYTWCCTTEFLSNTSAI